MRKQMVTLENKAEVFATQLRQRIGVQRGNILTGYAIGAAGGLIQAAENIHQGRFTGTRSADNRHHLTSINIEGDALQHLNLLITGRIAATNIL